VSYMSYMFLISLSEVAACLSNLACVTRKFIDTALVQILCITGLFWFCKLLKGIGTLEGYPYVRMLE
jgi:hypothetical protein